jgi:hypothetical protein
MAIVEASVSAQYLTRPGGGGRLSMWSFCESSPTAPPRPRLLDRVRQGLRARHLSRGTEEAYVAGIRRLIFFRDRRHPAQRGAGGHEVSRVPGGRGARGRLDPEPTAARPPGPVQKDVLEILSPGSTASFAVRNRADVRPVTPPVVSESICSGICDATSQPLTASESPSVQMQVVGAKRRSVGATKSILDRYIQQAFVVVAVIRRPAYPVAEL